MNPTRDYTNQHVSVETSQNETLEGFVYAHDSVLNSLAIYSVIDDSSPVVNFHVLNLDHVREIKLTTSRFKAKPLPSSDKAVNLECIQLREKRAVQKIELELSRFGVDVSSEAQQLFDALNKTLPCRWKADVIVVLDDVSIKPPYTERQISFKTRRLHDHVLKVLRAEQLKMPSLQHR